LLGFDESGNLPAVHFWGLGEIFGLVFIGALLLLGAPLLMTK
jgi:hypothetical protein